MSGPSLDVARLLGSGLLERAAETLAKRLAAEPDDVGLLRSLGRVQRQLGRLGDARAVYARLHALDPEDSRAAYLDALLAGRPERFPARPPGPWPAPYAAMPDFLSGERHRELLDHAQRHVAECRPVSVAGDEGTVQDAEVREGLVFDYPERICAWFRELVAARLPDVWQSLSAVPLREQTIELKMTASRPGDFFMAHCDDRFGRRVSFVYGFHRSPKRYSGGDLILYDTDWSGEPAPETDFTRIPNRDNCLVLFPSVAVHEALPVVSDSSDLMDSRFALVGHVRVPEGPER